MRLLFFLFLTLAAVYILSARRTEEKWPTVGISVLVRNKGNSLPYFFSCIENLDYPKDRIYISISSDYNEDNSDVIIEYWVTMNQENYHDVIVEYKNNGTRYKGEASPTQWTEERFRNVMGLRENALLVARQKWADYHLMLDADVYLTNPQILKHLVDKEFPVSAPMLRSDGMYSNFWAAISGRSFYKKSEEYQLLVDRKKSGCFSVPMIHSAVLVDMNCDKSDHFTYEPSKLDAYNGPIDDIVVFATSVGDQDVVMNLCNDVRAGYVQVPLDAGDDLKKDIDHLINIKLLALSQDNEIPLTDNLRLFVTYPEPSKFGLDEIYMINLERRRYRRNYMEKCFKEIGLDVKHFEAFDGLSIDMNNLPFNINLMPNYEDPFHKRAIKAGEVGCFLSHYTIWEEIVKNNYEKVMIMEDDVYFRPNFRLKLKQLLDEVKDTEWDILYIGRKILMEDAETRTTPLTVIPSYSYWTIGYILTGAGARKLLAAEPLQNMLPVDEFLPIMFDKHPNDTWKNFFPVRNLKALSAFSLLIEPIRYVNQPGYVSDTEASPVVPPPPGYISVRLPKDEFGDCVVTDSDGDEF